jgi:hypothetical protein
MLARRRVGAHDSLKANISGSFILHMHVPDAFWNISQAFYPISGANSPDWPAEPRASHER